MAVIGAGMIVAATLALTTSANHAVAQSRHFSCTGVSIAPTSEQSQLTARLNLDSPRTVTVDTGNGAVNASVVSNSKIQLKFRSKQFVGEFFHYTNDLFLIYPSGHLARLTCNPA
jgi:hypothetical protein